MHREEFLTAEGAEFAEKDVGRGVCTFSSFQRRRLSQSLLVFLHSSALSALSAVKAFNPTFAL